MIPRPSTAALFSASASVSFNSYLGLYLAVLMADDGFYFSASENGITWETPRLFFRFPVAHSDLTTGDTWYIYPSLLCPDQSHDAETGETGYLYYARGIFNVEPHHMVRRAFRLARWGSD